MKTLINEDQFFLGVDDVFPDCYGKSVVAVEKMLARSYPLSFNVAKLNSVNMDRWNALKYREHACEKEAEERDILPRGPLLDSLEKMRKISATMGPLQELAWRIHRLTIQDYGIYRDSLLAPSRHRTRSFLFDRKAKRELEQLSERESKLLTQLNWAIASGSPEAVRAYRDNHGSWRKKTPYEETWAWVEERYPKEGTRRRILSEELMSELDFLLMLES